MLHPIEVNEKVMGGSPVIAGTRIPLRRLKYLSNGTPLSVEKLNSEYPHISKEKAMRVIAYLQERGIDAVERDSKDKKAC